MTRLKLREKPAALKVEIEPRNFRKTVHNPPNSNHTTIVLQLLANSLACLQVLGLLFFEVVCSVQ